jgi:hypothetical protein
MLITIVVMGTVYQASRSSAILYRSESRRADRAATGLRALDDMATEIARAGFGLGDVQPVLAGLPGQRPSRDAITLRSNPEGVAGSLQGDLSESGDPVPVAGAHLFKPQDRVLLCDLKGTVERAEVTRADRRSLAFRSLDGPGGRLRRAFRVRHGARVLKAREVRFYPATAPDGASIVVKAVDGGPERVLARDVDELRFEYRDDTGEALSPSQVRRVAPSAVKARLAVSPGPGAHDGETVPLLSRIVALDVQSATVPFDVPRPGFRLRRVFHRIQNAVAVAARPWAEAGVIVAAGQPRETGPGYLYTFPLHKGIRDVRVDTFVPLGGMREVVGAAFAPEDGPLSGSLFLVTGGPRVEVWRVTPDSGEQIGPMSQLQPFASVQQMRSAGGAAFADDGALYLSDPVAGGIVRLRTGGAPGPMIAEDVAAIPGRPGPIALGRNGSLYVLADERSTGMIGAESALWEIPLEDEQDPATPRRVAALPGEPRSLARDPLTGSLHALFGERGGDTVLLELTRSWLRRPEGEPREAFRLSAWKREVETMLPDADTPGIGGALFPTRLEFAAFDETGAVYFGAAGVGLVLKCDLDRPGGASHHAVAVAAVIEQDRRSEAKLPRLLGWRRSAPGL